MSLELAREKFNAAARAQRERLSPKVAAALKIEPHTRSDKIARDAALAADPSLCTLEEVCAITGVGRWAIMKRQAAGRLTVKKFGIYTAYVRAEIEAIKATPRRPRSDYVRRKAVRERIRAMLAADPEALAEFEAVMKRYTK